MCKSEWEPVTGPRLAGFLLGMGVFLFMVFRSEPGFVFLLDHANLLFHEAGHPIVGIFSNRLQPYGGTIGQLAFPCIVAVGCWRGGQRLGLAASVVWFFENWLNIARYIADARLMELPLVGGGDHDWNTILSRWDVLQHDGQIAAAVRVVAWIGLMLPCLWVLWCAWKERRQGIEEARAIA